MGLLDTEVAKWKRAFGLLGGIPKTFKNNPRNAETMDAVFGFGGIIPGIGVAVSAAEAKYRYDQGDMLGAGLAGLGALPMVPALAGTFIGKKGINNLGLADVLKQAEAMEKAGKSRDEIWEATAQMAAKKGVPGGGIGRGVDKQWRFELDDSGSQIELGGGRLGFEPSPQQLQAEYATGGPQAGNVRTSLNAAVTTPAPVEGVTRSTRHNASFQGLEPPTSNLASGHNTPRGIVTGTHLFSNPQQWLDHYYLDKAYPELMYGKNAPNVRVDTISPGDSAYFPKMNYIVIRDEIPRHLKSKTLHELGHGIQRIEGHATGGNPATMPPNLGMTPEQVYWNQAGEAEARLTQSRMNMTPLDRQVFPPWSQKELGGYDVPEAQQIVRFGDGPAMSTSRPRNHLGQEIPPTPYELAHAEAQRVAALPVEQGGLGLPPDNTAMDRARAMGYKNAIELNDESLSRYWLHGSPDGGIEVINNGASGALNYTDNLNLGTFFTTNSPGEANFYAKGGHSNAYGIDRAIENGSNPTIYPVVITGKYKHNPYRTEYVGDGNVANLTTRGSSKEWAVPGLPSQIRSPFAAFNPAKRDSADLLAGLAPWALPVGATLLGGSFLLPPEEY